MRIHVVNSGESLWSIARIYNLTYQSIAATNKIPSPYNLAIGQSLVIPDNSKIYGTMEVNAYIEPVGTPQSEIEIFNEVAPYLTYLSIFSYRAQENGSLIAPPSDTELISAAKQRRVAPLMVVTNFRGGTFDSNLAHTVLSNSAIRQNLINNILQTLTSKNFYGVNIDFERVPPGDRDLYTDFLRRLRAVIRPRGYVLSTALAPKTSAAQTGAWYTAHDYGAHGVIADFVMLMTYEWGWSGGPPMPVAPINQVKQVLDYAVSVIPRNKILLGMPLYGYDWTLPYVSGGQFAPRVDPHDAMLKAARIGARIQYDSEAESPFYTYYDSNRKQHIVWFEDARSISAKFRLANQYGLRGVSYWVLGTDFPQNWIVLTDLIFVRKFSNLR